MGDSSCSTQIIDGDGVYNVSGMENFVKTVELGECGLSYVVVSIMGPCSSGKSTLLNHLFHTKFREMDAFKGRYQTTKGIWLARCVDIEPCTIIMDLEGSDGRGHGEDDTSFEKQSALFAFVVSDIVLINMWCHDIGREHAANRRLLRTVFQVIMRLFCPHKTLLFIIRDKTKTPLENLEHMLREDIQKIWDSVQKPLEHKNTPLSEFFNVEVVSLSSFEEKEEQFKEQVAKLRKRFFHSIAPGGLAGDRRGVIPASEFSFNAQQTWKVIKENKDIDLLAHKMMLMIATVSCEGIANERIVSFLNNEEWRHLEEAVQNGIVLGFAKKLSSILENCLIGFDKEAVYFDHSVRISKRRQLESKLLQFIQPARDSMMWHLGYKAVEDFKVRFDKALESGEGFSAAANNCFQSVMFAFDEACEGIEQAIQDSLKVKEYAKSVVESKEMEAIQDSLKVKEYAKSVVESKEKEAIQNSLKVKAYAKSVVESNEKVAIQDSVKVKEYAKSVVESKEKEEAGRALTQVKERFSKLFSHDSDSKTKIVDMKEDIKALLPASVKSVPPGSTLMYRSRNRGSAQ